MNSTQDRRPLIAHLIPQLAVGGLEKGVVTLINLMPADRYRHAIIAMGTIDARYTRHIRRPDVELVALDKQPGKDFRVYGRLWRTLRRMRPDVVHTRNLGALDGHAVAFAAGVPARIHGENGRDTYDMDGTNFKYNLLRRSLRPFIHRYSAVSADLANWLVRTIHVRRERVHQIYNGVDAAQFHPRTGPRSPSAFPGGLPEDAFVVGAVGRMVTVKDHLTLVDAFLHLLRERPELRRMLRLVIVGDGSLRAPCQDLLREAGAEGLAWLPGERADIPALLREMDLFVLPSLGEGISNTILEAMASGLPVVATRVGGNPELVQENRTGALFPVSETGALAVAIARYCDNPALARSHGTAAREEVEQHFTVEAMIEGYCRLYDQALDGRGGAYQTRSGISPGE